LKFEGLIKNIIYNCKALESFVLRCPTEITPFIQTIISLALQYIKYDPNYAVEDNDEDEMMEDQADSENGDEEDDDE